MLGHMGRLIIYLFLARVTLGTENNSGGVAPMERSSRIMEMFSFSTEVLIALSGVR
jgi:hypothetical protein